MHRISEIIDKLIEHDEVFREMDRTKMRGVLSNLVEKSSQELISITDDEFTQRIEKVMLIEAMSGMLNGLNRAQMEFFEAAVKRRKFLSVSQM